MRRRHKVRSGVPGRFVEAPTCLLEPVRDDFLSVWLEALRFDGTCNLFSNEYLETSGAHFVTRLGGV